jgi:hypothetical protein
MGERMVAYRGLVGKPEGKRPLGRPRREWEDNINILRKWDWGMGWIDLAQDRDRWRAVVKRGMSGLAKKWLASEGLCSLK